MRKVFITNDFQKQIDLFHNLCGDTEWSGICFYDVDTDLVNNDCVITPKYIFPMDVGNAAATAFDYTEVILDAYDQLPGAEDCREGIIHTHHRMGAFFSNTDTDELKENASNYDFYFSLVVDFKRTYKAKIAIKPTSIKAVIDRPSGRFEIESDNSDVFFIDLSVEYEDINVDGVMATRMKSLIDSNKIREKEAKEKKEKKPVDQIGYIPPYGGSKYYEKKYDSVADKHNNVNSSQYGLPEHSSSVNGGHTRPFQKDKRTEVYGKTITENKTVKNINVLAYDFLSKWISQDYRCTTALYPVIIDLDKEQRQYQDKDFSEALEYFESSLTDTFEDFFVYVYGAPSDSFVIKNYSADTKITILVEKFIDLMTTLTASDEYRYLTMIVVSVLKKVKAEMEFVYNIH